MKVFNPDWSYPQTSETISDMMRLKGYTLEVLATKMGIAENSAKLLINGELTVDNDIAKRLSSAFGNSSEFWISRESRSRNLSVGQIELNDLQWVKSFPVKEMVDRGWIGNQTSLNEELLDFFAVASHLIWKNQYLPLLNIISYRKSDKIKSNPNAELAWIRKGLLSSNELSCMNWDEIVFEESLDKIKTLTRVKSPQKFIPELIKVCANSGVALSIVPNIKGCTASGASWFSNEKKAIMILSHRYLSDDQFWFSFFHEAGHLLLHKERSFNPGIVSSNELEIMELEANTFAKEALIPSEFDNELLQLKGNKRKIISLASKLNISPGIIVGQLQHMGIIPYNYLNGYKRRLSPEDFVINH